MGRYYSGDIEGKFAFAIQNSDAADRFGVIGQTPNFLQYYFTTDDLESIKEGGLSELAEGQLSEYYDYLLGRKILDCIEETGVCSFDAEL